MKQSIKLIRDALASAKQEEAYIKSRIDFDCVFGELPELCKKQAVLILLIDDYEKGLDALKIGQINRMTGML